MKAVGYQHSLPISDSQSLLDIELPVPVATGHDVLVKVEAISVNPVDTKIRMRSQAEGDNFNVLGWDAVGTVVAVGEQCSKFAIGDKLWYAGELTRHGSNAEYQLVDERIAALAPTTLAATSAAALPLTAITAWELLFDRFGLSPESKGNLLVIGAAGGVGSILVQLAKQLSNLTVIATASRPESQQWLKQLGVDRIVNHHNLASELADMSNSIDVVASLTGTDQHQEVIAEVLKPQAKLALIDDPVAFNIGLFKRKSISIHWEFMYTRSLFKTADMSKQGECLAELAALVDNGKIVSTMTTTLGTINASNLKKAHAMMEAGNTIGKVVLAGFEA